MIAVIFEVFPKNMDDYMDIAAAMRPLAENLEGFISVERFQSMTNPEKYLSVSYFENEAAVARWRNVVEHRQAQAQGRENLFTDYRICVCQVLRDYTLNDRAQAPQDSRTAHEA